MDRILSTLKTPKADLLTLERPLNYSFEDLISKILLILLPIKLNKFDLKIITPVKDIFHQFKMDPLSKNRKDLSSSHNLSYLGKEKQILMDNPLANQMMMKNYIIQNIRVTNNVEFIRHCRAIIQMHRPSLIALLETRMVVHTKLMDKLGFNNKIQFLTVGSSGGQLSYGITLCLVSTTLLSNPQEIHVSVKVNNFSSSWFFIAICASNKFEDRKSLWPSLIDFANNINDIPHNPWLVEFFFLMKSLEPLKI